MDEQQWMIGILRHSLEAMRQEAAALGWSLQIRRPMIARPCRIDGRVQWRNVPAWFDYVFFRVDASVSELTRLRSVHLLRWRLSKQLVKITESALRTAEAAVNDLSRELETVCNAELFVQRHRGKVVRIAGGDFEGFEGVVWEAKGRGHVIVLFEKSAIRLAVDPLRLELLTEGQYGDEARTVRRGE